MSPPEQKPGRSKQDYGTPQELIDAIERRWGKLTFDLAASDANAKCEQYFTVEEDYLTQPALPNRELCWLNPPFDKLAKWVKKTSLDTCEGQRTIELVPAAVGSNWFADHVWMRAQVIALRPRIVFEGMAQGFPKDCMLLVWGLSEPQGFELWKWK